MPSVGELLKQITFPEELLFGATGPYAYTLNELGVSKNVIFISNVNRVREAGDTEQIFDLPNTQQVVTRSPEGEDIQTFARPTLLFTIGAPLGERHLQEGNGDIFVNPSNPSQRGVEFITQAIRETPGGTEVGFQYQIADDATPGEFAVVQMSFGGVPFQFNCAIAGTGQVLTSADVERTASPGDTLGTDLFNLHFINPEEDREEKIPAANITNEALVSVPSVVSNAFFQTNMDGNRELVIEIIPEAPLGIVYSVLWNWTIPSYAASAVMFELKFTTVAPPKF